MKKRLLAILLTVLLMVGMVTTANAYTPEQNRAAEALYYLDLFRGTSTTGKDFNLDRALRRDEGTIMLVRMLGREDEAKTADKSGLPFTDVPSWDEGCIAYAYKNKIVNGMKTGDYVFFGPSETMTDYMFLTLTLRALGYSDSGEGAEFTWNKPYTLGKQIGLISNTEKDAEFTRGDAVMVFWNALKAEIKGTGNTLADQLMREGVFTAEQYANAKEIWTYGYILSDVVVPSTPSNPVTPPDTPVDPDDKTENPEEKQELTYEEYLALSPMEQVEFFNSFEDPMDYVTWYDAAKAAYDAEQEKIEIDGDTNIDLGDIIDGQN